MGNKQEQVAKQTMYTLAKPVLTALLDGTITLDVESMTQIFALLEIPFIVERNATMIMIEIQDFQQIRRGTDVWGLLMLRRGVEIQIQLFFSKQMWVELLDLGDGRFVALIQHKKTTQYNELDHPSALRLQAVLKKIMGIAVNLIIGEVESLDRLHYHFNTSVQCEDLLYKSSERIIYVEEGVRQLPQNSKTKPYPHYFESRLSDSLIAGDIDQATSFLEKIVNIIETYPKNLLQQTLVHLAYCVDRCLATIQHNRGMDIPSYEFLDFVRAVQEADCLENALEEIRKIFPFIEQKGVGQTSLHHIELANWTKEYVKGNFKDSQMYRVSIADQIGVSPDYLSRIFSKVTGVSLNEYISDVRMEHAEIMLRNPDVPIKDVLVKCGYASETWFYKQFKQKYGVTPAEFRHGYLRHKAVKD